MQKLIVKTINDLGYECYRQGSFGLDEKYPPLFFTYTTNDTFGGSFYDNSPASTIYDYDVNCWSNDFDKCRESLNAVAMALTRLGFVIDMGLNPVDDDEDGRDVGYDIPSDEVTHYGRGLHVLYRRL